MDPVAEILIGKPLYFMAIDAMVRYVAPGIIVLTSMLMITGRLEIKHGICLMGSGLLLCAPQIALLYLAQESLAQPQNVQYALTFCAFAGLLVAALCAYMGKQARKRLEKSPGPIYLLFGASIANLALATFTAGEVAIALI